MFVYFNLAIKVDFGWEKDMLVFICYCLKWSILLCMPRYTEINEYSQQ